MDIMGILTCVLRCPNLTISFVEWIGFDQVCMMQPSPIHLCLQRGWPSAGSTLRRTASMQRIAIVDQKKRVCEMGCCVGRYDPTPYGASRKSSIAAITKSDISHWRLFILFLWTGFCGIFAHDIAKGLGNLSRKITQLYEMIVFGRTSIFDIKQASKSSKVWAPETGVCVFLSTAFRQYRLEKDIRPNKASASLQSDRLTKIWWLQGMSPWHPKPSLK